MSLGKDAEISKEKDLHKSNALNQNNNWGRDFKTLHFL